jgi:hypothetical protein
MLLIAWVYQTIFNCCRRVDAILFAPPKKDEYEVSPSILPWLWVGAVYPDGIIVDYTNDVNDSIHFGVHITPEWLNETFELTDVTWRYLDTTTLETTDFPSAGFVIHDPEFSDAEDSHNE